MKTLIIKQGIEQSNIISWHTHLVEATMFSDIPLSFCEGVWLAAITIAYETPN
jgi:hypothetical protein